MQQLIEGVHRFRDDEFGKYKALFHRLSDGQAPHTLFITCSDSRVIAELITQSNPGDLFVVKNVGNIVPPPELGTRNSTGAAIEFAVDCLSVTDIVVCGHSQCGAIAALLDGSYCNGLPHLAEWVETAAPVREVIQTKYQHLNHQDQVRAAEGENILFSIERLRSYPSVERKLAAGAVRLHAWFFKIATAELFAYDAAQKQFMPIAANLGSTEPPA